MVNRQRQSKITHNGSEMILFFRCASVLQIAFSKKPPNVVPPSYFRYTVLEAKETRKFRETALKAHKERHHFEVSDDLPSIVVILQGTQQHLDTGVDRVVIFEMHRVRHREIRVVVSFVKQHGFEAPG